MFPLPLSFGLPALFFFLHSLIPASSVANRRALVTIGLNGVHGHEDVTWYRGISLLERVEAALRSRREEGSPQARVVELCCWNISRVGILREHIGS